MKHFTLFFISFFVFSFYQLPAQNCQTIIAEVAMTLPAVSPPDTGYIDVCVGDTISLSANAIFPENDLFYHQDIENSSFRWIFGDGFRADGQTVNHSYDEPGGYKIYLVVSDQQGCQSENAVDLRVRVGGIPAVTFVPEGDLIGCQDDTLSIQANYENASTFNFNFNLESKDTVPLPDGTGAVYSTSIFINDFEETQVVSDTAQLQKVCINIEHSYMYDLDIMLRCPNGTEIVLQNQEFISNRVLLGIPYELDDMNTPVPPIPGIGYTYCWTPDATNGTWTEFSESFDPETLPEGDYNAFSTFDLIEGCSLNGEWQLVVRDQWSVDNGYVFGWSLQFDAHPVALPPFSSEITSYQWNDEIFSTTDSVSGHLLEGIISSSGELSLALEDSRGCSETFSIAMTTLSGNESACQSCDNLISDAGPDLFLNCLTSEVTLECSNSTQGEYIEYSWFDAAGNLLGNECNLSVDLTGLYILEVRSLANDCIALDTVAVLLDEESPVADAGTAGYLSCSAPSTQLGGPDLTTGPNMAFSWTFAGNVISNEPFPVVDQYGAYILEVTNTVNGCTAIDAIVVSNELLLSLDITTTSCNEADGNASVEISPAIQNPQVQWSTGESGLEINNLAQGWYSVTITDDTCVVQENFYVDQDLSCKVQISGYVYNDHNNQDCMSDNPQAGEECVLLHLMPLDIYTYSDPSGYYNFIADPGTYTIEILPAAYFELLCPASPNFTVDLQDNGSISQGHDFYLKYVPNSFDLSISAASSVATPGFTQFLTLEVCNTGEAVVDPTLTLKLDSLLSNFNSSPSYHAYDAINHQLIWNISNLQPGICREFDIFISIPTTIGLGTSLHFLAALTPVDADVIPSNNSKEWSQVVIGAYDPNDKQILTGSNQFGGEIYRQDSVLQYQLRFQNVGTAPAQTVVIRDTLDSDLDVTTIRAGISSHDYVLEFEGHNVLIFRFNDINLPDSTHNEPESHGNVTFSIELKDGKPFGTEIENSAAIFFDFNAPVITNTVISTLTKPQFVSNSEVQLCEGDEYEGVAYFESTTLIDTLDFIDYDSVYVTEIGVFPVSQIDIDTTLLPDQPYQGALYENDTILVQNLLSVAGCDSIVTVNIMVEMVDAEEESAGQIALQLYPNPVKETLQIRYRLHTPEKVSTYIYDVFGQKVLTVFSNQYQATEVQQVEISVADLPSGLYFFSIETSQDQYVKKFLKV